MSPTPAERQPWDKLPGESFPAYQGFATYRDLGLSRQVTKVARELSKSRQFITRWAAKWNWRERAEAYDHWVEERRRLIEEDEWRAANRQHRVVGRNLVRLANAELVKYARLSEGDGPVLRASELAVMLKTGVMIERMSHNQASELVRGAVNVSPHDTIRLLRAVVETAERYMDEDVYDRFVEEVAGMFGEAEQLGLEQGAVEAEFEEVEA